MTSQLFISPLNVFSQCFAIYENIVSGILKFGQYYLSYVLGYSDQLAEWKGRHSSGACWAWIQTATGVKFAPTSLQFRPKHRTMPKIFIRSVGVPSSQPPARCMNEVEQNLRNPRFPTWGTTRNPVIVVICLCEQMKVIIPWAFLSLGKPEAIDWGRRLARCILIQGTW